MARKQTGQLVQVEGKWAVRFTVKGKWVRYPLNATNQIDAEREAQALASEIASKGKP